MPALLPSIRYRRSRRNCCSFSTAATERRVWDLPSGGLEGDLKTFPAPYSRERAPVGCANKPRLAYVPGNEMQCFLQFDPSDVLGDAHVLTQAKSDVPLIPIPIAIQMDF